LTFTYPAENDVQQQRRAQAKNKRHAYENMKYYFCKYLSLTNGDAREDRPLRLEGSK